MPIREIFGTAVGILQIAPSEFYRMTPREYWAAFDAYVVNHGLDRRPGSRFTDTEIREQQALIEWAKQSDGVPSG